MPEGEVLDLMVQSRRNTAASYAGEWVTTEA